MSQVGDAHVVPPSLRVGVWWSHLRVLPPSAAAAVSWPPFSWSDDYEMPLLGYLGIQKSTVVSPLCLWELGPYWDGDCGYWWLYL